MADELDQKLTQLAIQIIDAALGEKVPLAEKVDALKIAGSFDFARRKLAKGRNDDPDDDSFGTFARRIGEVSTGARQ